MTDRPQGPNQELLWLLHMLQRVPRLRSRPIEATCIIGDEERPALIAIVSESNESDGKAVGE